MNIQSNLFETRREQAESKAAEFYATPAHIVHQLLDTARHLHNVDTNDTYRGLPRGLWIDAGCGTGAISIAVAAARGDVRMLGIDYRWSALKELSDKISSNDRIGFAEADWLNGDLIDIDSASVVVMNSPFCDRTKPRPYPGLTHLFVQAAFDHCPDAWVWSLQRQSWRAQRSDRAKWLADHHPEFILQCTGKRPSFGGTSGTDSCEYEWCGWSPTGRNRRHAKYAGFCK